MDGMSRRKIFEDLFGYLSDEDESNSENKFHDQANFVSDACQEPDGEDEANSNRRVAIEGVVQHDHVRSSSRSTDKEKGRNPRLAAIIRDIFGDSDDDELSEKKVCGQTNEEKRSPKYKGNYAEELRAGKLCETNEKTSKPKVTAQGVAPVQVFEIPFRAPPGHPNQMATFTLSNLIGIDPKPFDPATYVEEDIHVSDASGTKRCVPPAHVIRFRKVTKNDGTTSIESNARFVEWSDGHWQLFIGKEAFDVIEQDVQDLQSHIFLRHGKEIYESQGRISRKMKFIPSSVSSNAHRSFAALVNSRHKKVKKIRHYTPDMDPESMIKHNEKEEMQTIKAKGYQGHQLTPNFLMDRLEKSPKDSHKSSSSNVGHTSRALHISKGKDKVEQMREKEDELHEDSEEEPEGKGKKSRSKQVVESDEDLPPKRTSATRQNAFLYDSHDE